MKPWTSLLTLTLSLLILAGCGRPVFVPQADIQAGFEPTNLGFEVDNQGRIIVASHIATLRAKQGSVAAYIDGYRIDYFDASGNELFPGDSTNFSRGALNVFVPAGIDCDTPDPDWGCTVASEGVVFRPGPTQAVSNFITLDADMVDQMLALVGVGGAAGARAEIYFYGTDANNYNLVLGPYEIGITLPVAGG